MGKAGLCNPPAERFSLLAGFSFEVRPMRHRNTTDAEWKRSKKGNLYRRTDKAVYVALELGSGPRRGEFAVMVHPLDGSESRFLPGNFWDEWEAVQGADAFIERED
jgi:hypothetical protein